MSRCGECKLGCNEEGALYCEENLGYEQCIDRLQDALYIADRPQKVIAQVTFDEEKLREIVKTAVERFKEEYEITDRPQGEWIACKRGDAEWISPIADFYKCSICDKIVNLFQMRSYKYCPNCGCRMKEVDDDLSQGHRNPLEGIDPKPIPTTKHTFKYQQRKIDNEHNQNRRKKQYKND